MAAGDVGVMFFLLRMAFWLGVVLLLLPTGAAQRSPSSSEINASEAISAASATVGDVRGFCQRQPDACTVGSQVATAIGYKAEAGAKMLYEVLSEAMAPRGTGTAPSAQPRRAAGNKAASERTAVERTSQSTLTPADLAPPWRGPPPRKDSKHPA
ncbi:MAG: DUF5330 domain-containing protein [Xanthobacteraceae bacterium]